MFSPLSHNGQGQSTEENELSTRGMTRRDLCPWLRHRSRSAKPASCVLPATHLPGKGKTVPTGRSPRSPGQGGGTNRRSTEVCRAVRPVCVTLTMDRSLSSAQTHRMCSGCEPWCGHGSVMRRVRGFLGGDRDAVWWVAVRGSCAWGCRGSRGNLCTFYSVLL